jgi:hypothetical protein
MESIVDANVPVKGKCTWWREAANQEDAYDVRLRDPEKRWSCSCFVDGDLWTYPQAEIPRDCPKARQCRYYIKHT